MANCIAQAVGEGDEFYAVVNVGKEWTDRNDMNHHQLYWQEFVHAQKDWLKIFQYFARSTGKRQRNMRKCICLLGEPGIGKSWCTSFFNHQVSAVSRRLGLEGGPKY